MTSPKSSTPLSTRTKLITAASIGAVGLASLFAIGANLGILARADKRDIGTMSAAGGEATPATQVVDVGLEQQTDPLGATSAAVDGSQRFTVETAGTVDVSVIDGSAHLDLASPAEGWTATPAAGTEVAVVFTDDIRTLEFTAVAGPEGTVVGDLTESTSKAAAAPSARHDEDGHDDDHDSDHHDSDHHDDHHHDGSDDDD